MKKSLKRIAALMLGLMLVLPLQLRVQATGGELKEKTPLSVDPIQDKAKYTAVLYNNTNGLLTAESNAIAQTSEGFIWIGSYSGLIRYDGHTFEKMDSTTGITGVISLHVDHLDRLWVGTNDNGLALLEYGEFRMWSEKDGMGSSKIQALAEDNNGVIYAGTTKGVYMIYPDMSLHTIDDPRIADAYVERIKTGPDGLLYCITIEDDFFTLRDGKLVDYIDHTENSIQGMVCICPDPDNPGYLYIGTDDCTFYYGSFNEDAEPMKCTDISPLFNLYDIEKFGDQIWLTGLNGIGFIRNGHFHYIDDLPMNDSVGNVMADYEGNLWFTSTKQGVMKIVSNPFYDVFTRYGVEERVVNSTCLYDNKLFVATNTGLIVIGRSGQLFDIPLQSARTASGEELEYDNLIKMLDENRIRSVICDNQGYLWISTWRAFGLLRYDGKEVVMFNEEDGLQSDHIRAVCRTYDGKVLVALTGGLNVIDGDKVVAAYGEKDGIKNAETLCVAAAPNGDMILGSNGAGIYIINKDGVRCIDKNDGLSSGIIMRIKYDAERHVYWIVTGNSISWMTEDYKVHTVDKFPYSNNFDLYENDSGDMWVLSSNGIYVLPVEDLMKNENMEPVHYGIANGMPCVSTSNSYCEVTEKGDLYLSGNRGVVKVNINSSWEDIEDIKIAVPFIDIDGETLYPNADGDFIIPQDVQKLTIHGYVFNYSLSDPQVSYYLKGFDRENVTVLRSELGPVTYTNLPGGEYEFVMELKDAMGRGSKTISVNIVKPKKIYEHIGFLIFAGVLFFAAAIGGLWFFFFRKTAKMEKRHKEEMDKQHLQSELNTAREIQASSLPHEFPPFPDRTEFEIYASMDPAKAVGGDFYDFFFIDDDHLCLVIADVSGKGIPASLFMMISKTMLQNNAKINRGVSETLRITNEFLCSNNNAEMFVTVWMGILEVSTGKVTASNAGHEYPALMQDGRFTLMKDKHSLALGVVEGVVYEDYEFTLKPGDKIFVYTDGVPEATNAENQLFGTDRMVEALNEEPKSSPERVMTNVRKAVDNFVKEAEQFDDLTMLCIKYKG